MKSVIVIPTLNAGDSWQAFVRAVEEQSTTVESVIVIDSGSSDNTCAIAKEAGFNLIKINKRDFNHGGTRQSVVDRIKDSDIVIFLTQDASLLDELSIKNILSPFADADIAAVCGRQLPKSDSTAIAAHARLFNYPEHSFVRQLSDKERLGIKTVFLSNSFAAYRVRDLLDVGGFPGEVIFGEDMYVAARLLLSGKKIAYAADACVLHSHNYSLWQEFKRYFDIGVFHARQPWIMQSFGSAESEARQYIGSEISYLMKVAFWKIPESFLRSLIKYAAFRLGRVEKYLPYRVKISCCMNPAFFKKKIKTC